MDLQIVLGILGTAGVVSAFLFALKGILDQVPDVIRAWRRVVAEARRGERQRNDADPPESE
ncbi:hypothetical protein [Streptomyces monashensis]|uniref:Uncharacterized protein n=1 Tax=Streptomyces monashensis TaxID=1678012 RepID=A0A1S2P9Y1_9ACTN|nr:hypothetical protein [Streptomyces monashensis]OIJ90490.1 hypothetical protein BIV23_40235 [Streptomyces monashensis]